LLLQAKKEDTGGGKGKDKGGLNDLQGDSKMDQLEGSAGLKFGGRFTVPSSQEVSSGEDMLDLTGLVGELSVSGLVLGALINAHIVALPLAYIHLPGPPDLHAPLLVLHLLPVR
jgi:hypothetical protein